MASSSSSSSSGGSSSSSRSKCCEICFETYGNLNDEAIKLFCCSKLLCCLCVKGILSEQASRCPWCYRKWIERGFYQKSERVRLASEAYADNSDHETTSSFRIVTAASGEIKKEYESIREKAMSELRHQLRVDEGIAKQLYEEEQKAARERTEAEEADSALALQLSQRNTTGTGGAASSSGQPAVKDRLRMGSAGGTLRSGQKTLFDYVAKADKADKSGKPCAAVPFTGSSGGGSSTASSSSGSLLWACTACTYVNSAKKYTEACELCLFPRATHGSSSSCNKRARSGEVDKENVHFFVS